MGRGDEVFLAFTDIEEGQVPAPVRLKDKRQKCECDRGVEL
jgi:hypothetical protein